MKRQTADFNVLASPRFTGNGESYIHPCNQYREINRNMNAIRSQIFNTCPQTPFFPQRVKCIFRNGTNSRIGLSGKQRGPHIPIPVITQTKNTKIWANVQYRDPTCHIFILPYPLHSPPRLTVTKCITRS